MGAMGQVPVDRNGHGRAPDGRQARFVAALVRYPEASVIGTLALIGFLTWMLVFVQPWLRFIDHEVHEQRPQGSVFAAASIRGSAVAASGQVFFLELEDGSRALRIEDLVMDNGPGRRLVLSAASGSGTVLVGFNGADRFDLGAMSGNVGDMTFDIPHFVDLRSFGSVVVVSRSGDPLAFAPITS